MRLLFASLLLPGLLVLTACASYAPSSDGSGASREQVIAQRGLPDTQRALPGGGTRLEFPTGPYGRVTWFVDLDAAGQVVRSEQVLTETNFHRIMPGMTQDDVRQRLGRPGDVRNLARARGVVWSYRYENAFCLWFQTEFAADGTLRSAGYGERPECDRPNPFVVP